MVSSKRSPDNAALMRACQVQALTVRGHRKFPHWVVRVGLARTDDFRSTPINRHRYRASACLKSAGRGRRSPGDKRLLRKASKTSIAGQRKNGTMLLRKLLKSREDASMARLKVLIAGGGIGGITAMLALRQRGIDVATVRTGGCVRTGRRRPPGLLECRAYPAQAWAWRGAQARGYLSRRPRLSRLGHRRAALLHAARAESRGAFWLALLCRPPGRIARRPVERARRARVSGSARASSASIRIRTVSR